MNRLVFGSLLWSLALAITHAHAGDLLDRLDARAIQRAELLQLTADQRASLELRLAAIETRAKEWMQLATQHPDEPIWRTLAEDGNAAVRGLRASTILQDDMKKWWTSPDGVAAYTGGSYYLDSTLFDSLRPLPEVAPRGVAPGGFALQKENELHVRSGFESFLLHEFIHSQQIWETKFASGRGEPEAYKAQYRYLVACGVPETSFAMDLTLRQLVNYHVLSNIADRDALNNELGLNPVLASREPSSLLPSKDLLPIKSVEFNLPKPPSIIPKNPAVARAEVEQWRTHCLNQLNPDTDPGRLANKTAAIAAADAIHANGERFTCRNCRVEVRHWWSNGNQWQCPSCELCTFITDQRRPDGTTYGEFAQARIRAVQAQRAKVNADADALIAKLQNPR